MRGLFELESVNNAGLAPTPLVARSSKYENLAGGAGVAATTLGVFTVTRSVQFGIMVRRSKGCQFSFPRPYGQVSGGGRYHL